MSAVMKCGQLTRMKYALATARIILRRNEDLIATNERSLPLPLSEESVSSLSELLVPNPPQFRLGLWVALHAEELRPVVDLTVATELGGLAVFGDRRRGYGWLTGFDGYNRVSSWHYCCFHFYCHNRESSWWSEGQSEQFGSVVVVGSLHKALIQLPSRSSPGCPQTSQVRKDSRSAASMRWRMASSARGCAARRTFPSLTCRISNWRTVACSNSATKGSKSSHSCQRMSNQPSS